MTEFDPVIFECSATGVPAPTIVWFRDDLLLHGGVDPRITFSVPTETVISTMSEGDVFLVSNNLTLTNTMNSDSGTYICLAFNGEGRDLSVVQEFDLVVEGRSRDSQSSSYSH